MNGSNETPPARPGRGAADPSEEPSIRAERIFAGLTDETAPTNRRAPSTAAVPPDVAVTIQAQVPSPSEPRPPPTGEVLDFLASARSALERTARAVKAVRMRAKITAGDLAVMGDAIEQALEATNQRLTHLEHAVMGGATPDDKRTELAMDSLRSAVRRAAEHADGSSET